MHPSFQKSEVASKDFFFLKKILFFFEILVVNLSHQIVLVKGLQVQSFLKIKSCKGMFLEFGDSIRFWNKQSKEVFYWISG